MLMNGSQKHRSPAPQQTRNEAVLHVEGLCKRFRRNVALDNVGFSIPKASLTVILGPAGAGKTTTLRLVAGLDKPDTGHILLAGRDVARCEPKDRDVAMIFDKLALYPNKTGFENIASPLAIRGVPKADIEEQVERMAKVLKVTRVLKHLPKTMSGGERQRIALGRALIRTPSIFLLDEPLSSLDAMLRIELRAELKRLQRELGYSFLLATPDYNEALAIADTVIMLREGRVVQVDEPQHLYDRPVDRETARFIGAPMINIIPATVADGMLEAAGGRLPVPAHLAPILKNGPLQVELGLRPENIGMADPASAHFTAALVDVEPLGLKSVLTVRNDTSELRLLVDTTRTHDIAVGQDLSLEVFNLPKLLAFDPASGLLLDEGQCPS